jgi:hypothetical protein
MDDDELSLDDIVMERTVTLPMLSINVDFNDLMEEKGIQEAFKIIGELKDLLS